MSFPRLLLALTYVPRACSKAMCETHAVSDDVLPVKEKQECLAKEERSIKEGAFRMGRTEHVGCLRWRK